jgi:hypothetical protein
LGGVVGVMVRCLRPADQHHSAMRNVKHAPCGSPNPPSPGPRSSVRSGPVTIWLTMLSWLVVDVFEAAPSLHAGRLWRAGFTLLSGQPLELAADLFPGEPDVRPCQIDIGAAHKFRRPRKPVSQADEPLRKQNATSPPRIRRRPDALVILCQAVNLLDHLPGPFDAANQPRMLGVMSLSASFTDCLPGLTEG